MEKTECGKLPRYYLRVFLFVLCFISVVIVVVYYSGDTLRKIDPDIPKNYKNSWIIEAQSEPDALKNYTNNVADEVLEIEFRNLPHNSKIEDAFALKLRCTKGLIVSVECGGRLGNRIWEYASAWAVAKRLSRAVYAPQEILDELKPIFKHFQNKTSLEEITKECNIAADQLIAVNETLGVETLAEKYPSQHILLHMYIADHEVVFPYIQDFREEFQFKPRILQLAKKTIELAGGAGKTLISIHVRRTDFAEYLPRRHSTNLTDATYFKNAMQWYRERRKGPLLFLVVSDDVKWCRKSFLNETDVKIVSKNPAHDLALMSLCDYSIIDYGTFGYTGVFFSKGTAITLDVAEPFANYMAKHAGWTVFSKTTLGERGKASTRFN